MVREVHCAEVCCKKGMVGLRPERMGTCNAAVVLTLRAEVGLALNHDVDHDGKGAEVVQGVSSLVQEAHPDSKHCYYASEEGPAVQEVPYGHHDHGCALVHDGLYVLQDDCGHGRVRASCVRYVVHVDDGHRAHDRDDHGDYDARGDVACDAHEDLEVHGSRGVDLKILGLVLAEHKDQVLLAYLEQQ